MRLRLTVQRNSLPAANVLWNVPDTNSTQAYTITRLLEDVNHVIPLEAEQWGLEDYVVEVGGFECLHFSPVAQALKDDDHVSIRPLMTAEERARTLTGRHQISDDGRRLVDGIPFGRPYLRNPSRPAVRIPPRKRQRLDEADEDLALELELAGLPALLTNGDKDAGSERPARARRASKRVRFEEPVLQDEEDDSEEDDEDFNPEQAQAKAVAMAVDEDEDDSEDDSDFTSDAEIDSSTASDTSDSDSDSDSDSASSGSDSDSESDADSPPDVESSKGPLPTVGNATTSSTLVPPRNGRSATRARNQRRTRTNRLRHLKESGKLPPDADLKALYEYETNLPSEPAAVARASQPFATYAGKRKRIDEDAEDEDDAEDDAADDAAELDQRRQELMAQVGEDEGPSMVQNGERSQQTAVAQPSTSSQENIDKEQPAIAETPKKRLRPDTSAIGRILARQAMPFTKKPSKTKPVVEDSPEPEGASDPNFWQARINLSAFECWEEEFELSAPPYPFKQHWDPASKLIREKAEKKKQKRKGGKSKRESLPVQEEEEEAEKIYLDYDDTGATESPEAEVNAAIEDQLRQDVATAAHADLPPLPEDVSTLPDLSPGDINQGAVIVCKFFSVNPITITPEISGYKTAIVDREGDSGHGAGTIRLKIAQRDLPKRKKKYDSNGKRIYDAADQFFMDGEEEDDGLWEGQFGELLEGKLLQAA